VRKAIRDALVAPGAIPSVGTRVYEPGVANENTQRPYIVVEEGGQDAGTAWGTHAEPVTVFIEGPTVGSNGKTALRIVDEIERQVDAVLNNRVIVDEDTGERLQLVYAGNAGPDTVPPPAVGTTAAPVRARVYAAFTLGWQHQTTLEPDPIGAFLRAMPAGWSEVQTVTMRNTTGGTFRLGYNGAFTGNLAYNASAAQVQTALQAIPAIGAGNVSVAGNLAGPYTLRFQNARANQDVPQVTIDTASLVGTDIFAQAVTTRHGAGIQTDPSAWNPTDSSPAVYWRPAQIIEMERMNWGEWVTMQFRGHVLSATDEARRTWVRRVCEYLAVIGKLYLSDNSPLFLFQIAADFTSDAFREGQIVIVGRYGVLQEQIPGLLDAQERINHATLRMTATLTP
jgi:hypothetical protein